VRLPMRHTRVIVAIAVLAGCAVSRDDVKFLRHYPAPIGEEARLPSGFDVLVPDCRTRGPIGCTPIRLNDATTDAEEAWKFTEQPGWRTAGGGVYQPQSIEMVIVGQRPSCEAVRAIVELKGTPTTPCQGPVRFIRSPKRF